MLIYVYLHYYNTYYIRNCYFVCCVVLYSLYVHMRVFPLIYYILHHYRFRLCVVFFKKFNVCSYMCTCFIILYIKLLMFSFMCFVVFNLLRYHTHVRSVLYYILHMQCWLLRVVLMLMLCKHTYQQL